MTRDGRLVHSGDCPLGGLVLDLTEWPERSVEFRLRLEEQIVDLLDKMPGLQEESNRRLLADRTARAAEEPLQVPENQWRRLWFFGFVAECSRLRRGLGALRDSVRALMGQSGLAADLAHLVDCWYAADIAATAVIPWRSSTAGMRGARGRDIRVLPAGTVNVWDELRTALSGYLALDVRRDFQVATGDRETAPPWYCETAWQVFVHLVNRGTFPGLPPPYLVFLDRLIHHNRLEREVEPLVEAWVRWVATEHGSLAELDRLRGRRADEPVGRSPVHLVLRLEGAGPAPDHYDLSWRLERYQPRQVVDGGARQERLDRDELEGAVSTVVRQVERILSTTRDDLALEFVLPFDLLHVEVEWWRKEQRYGSHQPLALDYSVTLRSLERQEESEWHRVWHERWQHVELPAGMVTYWCSSLTPFDGLSLKAELRANLQLMVLVLSGPPRIGSRGMEELLVGLSAGIAGIIWRRSESHPAAETDESLRDCLNEHQMADLPRAAHRLRLDSQRVAVHARHHHIGRQIALLWDDPRRIDVPGGNGP